MTYGYQSGSGFGSHKQALGFDAGASERMRVEGLNRERHRIEKERAKQQLQDLQRKHEHNKTEISNKQTEARRLIAEITHVMHEVQDVERALRAIEQKEHASKMHVSEVGTQIQEAQKQTIQKKKEAEEINHEIDHLEKQISLLQQKVTDFRKRAYETSMTIQKIALQIKQLESQENRNQTEVSHAKSDEQYKLKDLDNKKRSLQVMDQKRMREIGEIQRLEHENARLEAEIRMLEAKAK